MSNITTWNKNRIFVKYIFTAVYQGDFYEEKKKSEIEVLSLPKINKIPSGRTHNARDAGFIIPPQMLTNRTSRLHLGCDEVIYTL